MTNKEIIEIFEDIFFEDDFAETSRLHSPEISLNKFGNVLVCLYGGMNGFGQFKDYLYDLYELINCLEGNNIEAYIVNWDIDALDDVFKVTLELKDLKESYKDGSE